MSSCERKRRATTTRVASLLAGCCWWWSVVAVQAWWGSSRTTPFFSGARHREQQQQQQQQCQSQRMQQRTKKPALVLFQQHDQHSSSSSNHREHHEHEHVLEDGDDYFSNQARVWLVDCWSNSSSNTDRVLDEDFLLKNDCQHGPALASNQQKFVGDGDDDIRFVPILGDAAAATVDPPSAASTTASSSNTRLLAHAHEAAITTWNWCAHFVARQNLCPWATGSVRAAAAIRLYVLPGSPERVVVETVLERVATDFANDLMMQVVPAEAGASPSAAAREELDPSTAIAFVILVPPPPAGASNSSSSSSSQAWYDDFATFSDWFFDFEQERWWSEQVTLAPFHPEWQYYSSSSTEDHEDDDGDILALEKQSPYATVSLVSTAVLDQAGPAATRQIAAHNQEILLRRSAAEWRSIYEAAVHYHNCCSPLVVERADDNDDDQESSFQ